LILNCSPRLISIAQFKIPARCIYNYTYNIRRGHFEESILRVTPRNGDIQSNKSSIPRGTYLKTHLLSAAGGSVGAVGAGGREGGKAEASGSKHLEAVPSSSKQLDYKPESRSKSSYHSYDLSGRSKLQRWLPFERFMTPARIFSVTRCPSGHWLHAHREVMTPCHVTGSPSIPLLTRRLNLGDDRASRNLQASRPFDDSPRKLEPAKFITGSCDRRLARIEKAPQNCVFRAQETFFPAIFEK
jgi:hypothetical protein